MRSIASSFLLVAALVALAGVLWLAGRTEERVAAAEYTLVALRYERAADEMRAATRAGLLTPLLELVGAGRTDQTSTAPYWLGDYDGLDESEDPSMKLLSANADYWRLRLAGGPWQGFVARLDSIAKRYADVLRSDPGNEDAAFNYEFVLRLRDAAAAARRPIPPADPAASGLTIHGLPGAPPQDSDAKKFKMIVPMLPDERQEAEEAGRAARKVRKG